MKFVLAALLALSTHAVFAQSNATEVELVSSRESEVVLLVEKVVNDSGFANELASSPDDLAMIKKALVKAALADNNNYEILKEIEADLPRVLALPEGDEKNTYLGMTYFGLILIAGKYAE